MVLNNNKSIDIIIPTVNRKLFLEYILINLKEKTVMPHRIIIVQNPCRDDTNEFLDTRNDLYDIRIKLDTLHSLGECLNIGLNKVESEDFVVTNDDILIYNKGWLQDLYRVYKEGGWFAVLPFMVPYPVVEQRPNFEPIDYVYTESWGINSIYRIQNTKVIRDIGGFQWERNIKDREGSGFGHIIGLYKKKSKKEGNSCSVGRYLKIRGMDMWRGRRPDWNNVLWKYDHFKKTGEVMLDKETGSDIYLVPYVYRKKDG